MRMLLLLRGVPGCGKSYWVAKNNLQSYTVSSDALREMMGSNLLDINGKYGINQEVSATMWGKLYEILEIRFGIGAFTVLDSTNVKTADMSKVYKLAKQYRYRVYCVDFSDVPIETCIERDSQRDEHKRVGTAVIERMYNTMKSCTVPGGIKVIKPDNWLEETGYRSVDLSNYKKIHHIGDIHGCYTALMNYLGNKIHQDEFYIFIGDYIDRGIENVETINYLARIADYPNVVLLEGNHDKYLWAYYNNSTTRATEFESVTRPQFDAAGENLKSNCGVVARKLRQCFIYKYDDKVVFCNHGGISTFPENVSLINTDQLVKGVGQYRDMIGVDEAFSEQNWGTEIYQIHGHRNVEQVPIEVNKHCFNLCEHIEYGGNLRSLVLDKDGFHSIYTPNTVYKKSVDKPFNTVEEMIEVMTDNSYIKVVPQGNINVSSFNFTRDAFTGGIWNGITTKARGLFINTSTKEIVARGYDKFFNVNERPETNLDVLPNTVAYPVVGYKKENGFLGLLGFDKESDRLLFCSKSQIGGTYSHYFKNLLLKEVKEETLYNYMKPHNVTLVFEVIDIVNDPHIIKYQKSKVVLLDIIENSISFSHYSYDSVKETAELLGVECKERSVILNNPDEFKQFAEEMTQDDFKWKNRYIEGFVFEDSRKFMFKYKTNYYNYWKYMRSRVESIKRGQRVKIDNPFINWVLEDIKNRTGKDIISLRTEYQETHR